MSSIDFVLELLLELDGDIYYYPSGYWHKIMVRRVPVTINCPQGIKYSLTLHDPNGERVLGFDNAHLAPGERYDRPYDHMHRFGRVINYQYQNAEQLLTDFYCNVEILLASEKEYET